MGAVSPGAPTVPDDSEWMNALWGDDDPWIFPEEARVYVERLMATALVGPGARVLDFGSGFGFVARRLAPFVRHIAAWDALPVMRARTRAALAGVPNASLIDLSDPVRIPARQFDVILVNSVVQYMTSEMLATWLHRWACMVDDHGHVIVSDLIPRGHRPTADLLSLLSVAARGGFLWRAVRGGVRRVMRHRRVHRHHPLLSVDLGRLDWLARSAGLASRPLPRNLTALVARNSVVLTPVRHEAAS